MYKVIIVDDEAMFRRYLRGVIDWEAHGFRLCGEAKNGLMALELVKEHEPDIAIVDINMPYLNGLDLSEQLKETFPYTYVLIVTGHSEFEYARKAIKLGVVDYILKPFDEEELLMALTRTKSAIDKIRMEHNQEENRKQLLKESFLNLLISSEYNGQDESIRQQMNLIGLREDNLGFQVVTLEIDDLHLQWPGSGEVRLRKYIIANLLGDLLNFDGKVVVFNGPEERVVSLLQFNQTVNEDDYLEGFSKLSEMIKKHFSFSVTIGAGNPGQGIFSIRKSYVESVIALNNKISIRRGDIILYKDIESRSGTIGFYPSEMNENLLISLRTHDESEIRQTLNAVQVYIRTQQLSGDNIHMILAGLVSVCLTYIYEIGRTAEELFPEGVNLFRSIAGQPTIEAAFDWVMKLYLTTMKQTEGIKHSKSGKLLSEAIDFIGSHYADHGLKVEDVARALYVQSRYLRKIFKQELGKGISDYITEVRMQKAKELLSSGGNLRLADIAGLVGYSDPGHFSKSFKKHAGMTPSEYEVMRNKLVK
ncbi:response regulator [Paenibacillus dakarensis]|uniref:response regulator n=1 Tax=Paenibacillus dakarensis TaxID=1527293 RepID=UPI0006D53E02|nr:response regulator [Paenibacillus dakarensis]